MSWIAGWAPHNRHSAEVRTDPSHRRARLAVRATLLFGIALLVSGIENASASAADRPFSPDSYWNVSISTRAAFRAIPSIERSLVGLTTWLIPDGVSIPVFQADSNSIKWKVLHNADTWSQIYRQVWKSIGNTPDVEAQIRASATPYFPPSHSYVSQSAEDYKLPSKFNPVANPPRGETRTIAGPATLYPSGDEDSHLVVVQPTGEVVELFGAIVLSSHEIVCETYQITDPALAGDGWQNGVTAAMIPVYAGLIRVSDIKSGQIDHAMKLLAPASLLSTSFLYPAASFDRGALREVPPYSGTLPMGARLALPPNMDLKRLGIQTRVGRMIAKAAQQYGFIVTDRGGAGISVVLEAAARDLTDAGWTPEGQADLEKVIRSLQRVTIDTSTYRTSEEILGLR